MRIIFVGQSPSFSSQGLAPMAGKSGRYLAELMGLTQETMLVNHDFVNVLDKFPGKNSCGMDNFPLQEARNKAERVILPMMKNRVVILLGKNVGKAFNMPKNVQYFCRLSVVGITDHVWIIPHPSGLNRFWNHEVNVLNARKFFTEILSDVKS